MNIECPMKSVEVALATISMDVSTDAKLAWIWGVILGWDKASMKELIERFGWTSDTVARLDALRRRWVEIEKSQKGK